VPTEFAAKISKSDELPVTDAWIETKLPGAKVPNETCKHVWSARATIGGRLLVFVAGHGGSFTPACWWKLFKFRSSEIVTGIILPSSIKRATETTTLQRIISCAAVLPFNGSPFGCGHIMSSKRVNLPLFATPMDSDFAITINSENISIITGN